MEGQGVAASAAAGRGESGPGAGVTAEPDQPAENHVSSDIADGGEGQRRNGDDSHVMVAPGNSEASAQDASMSHSPESSEQSSQESQPELPSQQIESDKLDNIVDPDRNNSAVARDENTGHNQTAAGLAPPAVDAPAVNVPAADAPPAVTPPETAATAGSVPPETAQPAQSAQPAEPAQIAEPAQTAESAPPEPVTEQFPAIAPETTEPVSGSSPRAAQPGAARPEPVTEQFPAITPSPRPSESAPASESAPVSESELPTPRPPVPRSQSSPPPPSRSGPGPPRSLTSGSTRVCSRPLFSTSGSGSPPFPSSSRSPGLPRSRSNAASFSARSTTTCCPACAAPPHRCLSPWSAPRALGSPRW